MVLGFGAPLHSAGHHRVRPTIALCSWLAPVRNHHSNQSPIRCGISYGRAYIDPEKSLFVGSPIIEAYRLEQSQLWAGAALTPAAAERLPQDVRAGTYADWWVIPYRVPTKEQPELREKLAVNWTIGGHPPGFKLRWSAASDVPTQEDWREKPDVCRKFENTQAFHNSVCWCRPSADPTMKAER